MLAVEGCGKLGKPKTNTTHGAQLDNVGGSESLEIMSLIVPTQNLLYCTPTLSCKDKGPAQKRRVPESVAQPAA